jgi:hypothetical protein
MRRNVPLIATGSALCLLATLACTGRGAGASGGPAATPATAVSKKNPCPPPIAGSETLTSSIVILGEMHGTAEGPAAFSNLVCEIAARKPRETVLVGLEIPADAQDAVNGYLDSDGSAAAANALLSNPFWLREYQDGRSSEAMRKLLDDLRRYRAMELKIEVRALDASGAQSAAERDALMAGNLLKGIAAIDPKQTLVLVGDVHSRILSGYPWRPNDPYLPLGALLRATHDDVIGLHISSGGGSAWTCQSGEAKDCGARDLKAREITGATPRFELHPEELAKSGWSGTLYLSQYTASPPALSRK